MAKKKGLFRKLIQFVPMIISMLLGTMFLIFSFNDNSSPMLWISGFMFGMSAFVLSATVDADTLRSFGQ